MTIHCTLLVVATIDYQALVSLTITV